MNNEPQTQGVPAEPRALAVEPARAPTLNTIGAAVFALLVLASVVALVVRTARLRARVRRLEREGAQLSRTVANVQGWAQQQLGAVRCELSVARMNEAAVILVDDARKLAAPAAPPVDEDPEATRDTLAIPAPTPRARSGQVLEMVPSYPDDTVGEEEPTEVDTRSAGGLKEATRYDPRPAELSHRQGRAAILVPTFRAPDERIAP
jgi:hypothetical protein